MTDNKKTDTKRIITQIIREGLYIRIRIKKTKNNGNK